MSKLYTDKNLSAPNYIKALKRLRERIRVEILGERNKEYRGELKRLLKATDRKIVEVIKDQEKEAASRKNPSDEVQ